MKKILIIGASGFVGKRLAKQLLADGYRVRCLVRARSKVEDLSADGCEIMEGDFLNKNSVAKALHGVDAVYVTVHTLSKQPANKGGKGFMDVEKAGIENLIEACRAANVNRVIYLTALGSSPDSSSLWLSGRWETEQLLIKSGLNATVIRPGMIVGIGGQGFNAVVANGKKKKATVMGNGKTLLMPIAVTDLVYYLEGILDFEAAYGKCFDVGNDEVLTMPQMIDIVADLTGNPHPKKSFIPIGLLKFFAPLIELVSGMPKGAIKGGAESMKYDLTGHPEAIRQILPKPLLTFREAAEAALKKN